MPTDPRVETLALLRSIDASLKALLARDGNGAPIQTIVDSVCNGPHGDPIVKAKDPRDWSGDPMQGKHFSECPPAYLDMLADRYDYFATKDEDATKQRYAKLDAARARAWAARLRSGWVAPTGAQTVAPTGGFADDDAGF